MSAPELITAMTLYSNAQKARINQHLSRHNALGTFTTSLRQFERQLGGTAQDEFWRTFLSPLKRYRFERCAAPLPFNHASATYAARFKVLRDNLRYCDQLYPQHAEPARKLLGDAEVLTFLSENPLIEQVRTLKTYGERRRTALLLKEPRFVTDVEAFFAAHYDLRHIAVVTPPQLRTDRLFDTLVVIGPMRWYGECEYVFTAPRAHTLYVIRYTFLNDGWEAKPVFTGKGARTAQQPNFAITQGHTYEAPKADTVEAEEVLPTINWGRLMARAVSWARSSDTQDLVPAWLCLLEDERAVFLDAADSSSALTVDVHGSGEDEIVRRVKASDLEPETFLVLRTSGGGDYIRLLADKILGQRAEAMRQTQAEWKKLLRDAVERRGIAGVRLALSTYGAKTANETNIRNWMSARTIRPRHLEDFTAIMRLVNLDEQIKRYWTNAQKLGSAHQRAGQHIRKLLLERVRQADLERLEGLGYMAFELPELQGGSIAAYRVKGIDSSPVDVPFSQLGRVFETEGGSWHG